MINIEELTKSECIESLSIFSGRDVELFRSADPYNTAGYFTSKKDHKAYFEIIRFAYSIDNNNIYVRYPDSDVFLEMCGGGSGSCRGTMMSATSINPWGKFSRNIFIQSHDDNMLLTMETLDFNFLKRVACCHKGNKINYHEIEQALTHNYIKLPEDVVTIAYCYRTIIENQTTHYVVTYPKYNRQYEKYRFYAINNEVFNEYTITEFNRYRDGGTTKLVVVDENKIEHLFFVPTKFGDADKKALFDDTEMVEDTSKVLSSIIERLQLRLSI